MKVWIKYPTRNPDQPTDWLIYDAATGTVITNLRAFNIRAYAGVRTTVELIYGGGRTKVAELVAEPARTNQPSQEMVTLGLRRRYLASLACNEFDLEAQAYRVDAQGVAQPTGTSRGVALRITDADYGRSHDPEVWVQNQLTELGRELGATLVRDLLNQNGKPMGLPLHARAMLGGLTIVKPPAPKQPTPQTKAPFFVPAGNGGPAAKCAECGGTGQWENPVSGKRSPCSRGCKP